MVLVSGVQHSGHTTICFTKRPRYLPSLQLADGAPHPVPEATSAPQSLSFPWPQASPRAAARPLTPVLFLKALSLARGLGGGSGASFDRRPLGADGPPTAAPLFAHALPPRPAGLREPRTREPANHGLLRRPGLSPHCRCHGGCTWVLRAQSRVWHKALARAGLEPAWILTWPFD